jgi:hypothetical protein
VNKTEAEKARKAGAALRRADQSTLPVEAFEDPVGACPFPAGDPQRVEWLEGYRDEHERIEAVAKRADVAGAIEAATEAVKA